MQRSIRGPRPLPRVAVLAILCIVAAAGLTGCARTGSRPVSESSLDWLGTTTTITIYDNPTARAFSRAFRRVGEIHNRMSLQLETSELSRLTQRAGIEPVIVSPDTLYVVQTALEIAEASDGAFNPAIGPLVALWDITGDFYLPSPEEVAELLPLTDFRLIEVNERASTVYLPLPGMRIDLGAIAKGYAADEAARILREEGVQSAILDFGGNIYVVGSRPDGEPWRIGVQDPFLGRGNYLGVYRGSDQAVVTSGTYERFVISDGVKYHHILDPDTGFPADSGVEGVTILAEESSTLADAYSTAAFVLGLEKGMAFIQSIPGVEALFVLADRSIVASPSLAGENSPFRLTGEDFELRFW